MEKHLPKSVEKLIVKNVLFELAKILKEIYPDADIDYPDLSLKLPKKNKYKGVKFGNNVLIGKNVKIGKNCLIGHNTIIESNVVIGDNCSIGSNVIIRNTIIKNDVHVLDHCVVGKKGFGFFPKHGKHIRYPHIGLVIIMEGLAYTMISKITNIDV